jgi:hypothetical protein
MAYHKKNLLEAFQASAAADKAKAAEDAASGAAKAGGPFAQGTGLPPAPKPAPPQPQPQAQPEPEPPRPARPAWGRDGLQRLIVLQLVITVAAFFLGRASVSRVDASEPSEGEPVQAAMAPSGSAPSEPQSAPQPEPQEGSGAEVDREPGTPHERALLDPANRYTVKLVEYRKGRDDDAALSTLQFLLDQGLPAVAQVQGGRLFILLGAAPTQSELDDLLETAQTMSGPPPLSKPAEFADAYVVGIDRLGIR